MLDPEVVSRMLSRRRRADPLDELSPRELEVLELMAQGRSNRGIAEQLVITDGAVEKHVTAIFDKLGIDRSSEAPPPHPGGARLPASAMTMPQRADPLVAARDASSREQAALRRVAMLVAARRGAGARLRGVCEEVGQRARRHDDQPRALRGLGHGDDRRRVGRARRADVPGRLGRPAGRRHRRAARSGGRAARCASTTTRAWATSWPAACAPSASAPRWARRSSWPGGCGAR